MLENTFIHILGIGPKTEQAIWRKGIRTWKDFLSSKEIVISTRRGFRERAAYLDIETSGMYPGADEITVIGIYDGYNVYTFVSGRNMSEFEQAIASYDIVITFNGSSFDLPFIRESFPGISLPPAHIDLRFLLRRLGYRGGLKYIEKRFGISRDQEIDGMDGYEAVRLWQAYQWGDETALDLLIRYNTADIVNLKPLMEKGHDMMKGRLVSFPV